MLKDIIYIIKALLTVKASESPAIAQMLVMEDKNIAQF